MLALWRLLALVPTLSWCRRRGCRRGCHALRLRSHRRSLSGASPARPCDFSHVLRVALAPGPTRTALTRSCGRRASGRVGIRAVSAHCRVLALGCTSHPLHLALPYTHAGLQRSLAFCPPLMSNVRPHGLHTWIRRSLDPGAPGFHAARASRHRIRSGVCRSCLRVPGARAAAAVEQEHRLDSRRLRIVAVRRVPTVRGTGTSLVSAFAKRSGIPGTLRSGACALRCLVHLCLAPSQRRVA